MHPNQIRRIKYSKLVERSTSRCDDLVDRDTLVHKESVMAVTGQEEAVAKDINATEIPVTDSDYHTRVLESPEISCSDVENLFGDYVEGELPKTLRDRLDAHIARCVPCNEFQISYKRTIELAGQLKEKPIPIDVQNRLRARLNSALGLKLPYVD